ncbi:CopG family transcriptional regulator [Candidatus Pacearchaeota archaeon]|nr:CopG family transcriptional regulator [Candidatus Pacearchaeota archaeon]
MGSVNIKISEAKKGKLMTKGADLGFETIEEYVGFILDQVLEEDEDSEDEVDEKEVRERLKDLGYI